MAHSPLYSAWLWILTKETWYYIALEVAGRMLGLRPLGLASMSIAPSIEKLVAFIGLCRSCIGEPWRAKLYASIDVSANRRSAW